MSQSYRLKISRNALKLKVNTRIPAQLTGGTGIEITKANGVYTFDLNYDEIGTITNYTDALESTTYIVSWESIGDDFAKISITDFKADLTASFGLLYQPLDAELTAIAGLTSAADKLPYFTGSGTAALADFSAFARTLVDDADATTARATLGLVIGTNVQAFDADLAALAANSTDGLWAHTGAGTGAARTLTAPAAGITITNPAGIAGNPTLVLANDLAALEGLASTGIAVRSAADTWVQRSVAGTANEITLTNGDGVSGNPTASLPTALTFTGKTVTGGTFATITASGTWAVSGTWTLPAVTLGGTVSSNGQSFSGTIANLGTVTTADINGGTLDGTVIGGASAAAGTFTTIAGTTGTFSSFLDLTEIASPANPSADHTRLFAKDVAGATHLFTRDSAGTEVDLSAGGGGGAAAATQAEQEAGSSTSVYTSPGRQQFHPSAAKFWGFVTYSAGTPTLQTNYNITSITDTAVGRLTVTIATDFSSANWAGWVAASTTVSDDSSEYMVSIAAGSVEIRHLESATVATDPFTISFGGFGDQ